MLITCYKVKLKHLLFYVASFVLGCFVTFNLTSWQNASCPSVEEQYSQIVSQRNQFTSLNYLLIIVIISSVGNTAQRNAIRETWGLFSRDNPDVKYYFITGGQGLSQNQIITLKNEQITYDDLFILTVPDSYDNLTKKVLKAFVWFETEFNFKYILKCDDDSFVIIPKIVHELQNSLAKHDRLYWGYFNGRGNVKQGGKWKDSSWFLCDRYLPYSLGGGYVLSRNLVQYIKLNEPLLRMYVSEDVTVGSWLSPLNVTLVHDVRFDTEYMSRGCNNSFIVTHKKSPRDMRSLYETFLTTGNLCKKEFVTRNAYEYNWNVLPSKCCIVK